MNEADRFEILAEHFDARFDALMENIGILLGMLPRLERVEVKVDKIQADIQVIKSVVREHSDDINELKSQARSHQ